MAVITDEMVEVDGVGVLRDLANASTKADAFVGVRSLSGDDTYKDLRSSGGVGQGVHVPRL